MKFWITTYALTTGITIAECDISRGYACAHKSASGQRIDLFAKIGTNAFETEEEAHARVVELAKSKIKSLSKQIEKMRMIVEKYEDGER